MGDTVRPELPEHDVHNALERTTRARRRLAELLAPKTDQERELVGWLGETLDLQRLLVLAELVGYRRSR